MFGPVGWQEILMILVLALLVFGPRRLPELGRTLGRAMGEFRRASADLRRTLNAELALEDDERSRAPRRPELAAAAARPARPELPAAGEAPADTTPRGTLPAAPSPEMMEPFGEPAPATSAPDAPAPSAPPAESAESGEAVPARDGGDEADSPAEDAETATTH